MEKEKGFMRQMKKRCINGRERLEGAHSHNIGGSIQILLINSLPRRSSTSISDPFGTWLSPTSETYMALLVMLCGIVMDLNGFE